MKEKKYRLEDFKNIPEKERQFKISFARNKGAIILSETKDLITVGVTEITDLNTKKLIESMFAKKCKFVAIELNDLHSYLSLKNKSAGKKIKVTDDNDLERFANDTPTVNLVNSLILEGIKLNASDIHIEAENSFTRVRYRIDGELVEKRNLSKDDFMPVSVRIKVMANMNILETRLPQDGKIKAFIGGKKIDLRISTVPSTNGESIVLRILGKNSKDLNILKLGFSDLQLNKIKKLCKYKSGLIIVTGPTGSGKSTTLGAILKSMDVKSKKIISMEDPVEYSIEGITQIQCDDNFLKFDEVLSRILRQDPDVLMVGEIRDSKTANLCARAALTGHLVFTTLHAKNSKSAVSRLLDLGIEKWLIDETVYAIISQRLVRKKAGSGRILISEILDLSEKENFISMQEDAEEKIKKGLILKTDVKKELFIG